MPASDDVLAALVRLDALLEPAIADVHATFGIELGGIDQRGLEIAPREVDALLARAPGGGLLGAAHAIGPTGPVWQRIAGAFGLGPFELDVLVVALAPDVDLRYERIYGYLQDDVTRRRPTVELCLNLLSASVAEKLTRVDALRALAATGVICLVPDPNHVEPPLPSHYVVLDEHLCAVLLGRESVDPRVAGCVERRVGETGEAPKALVSRVAATSGPVYVRGGDRTEFATAVAAKRGVPLLALDLVRVLDDDPALERLPALIARQARLDGAVVLADDVDALSPSAARRLGGALGRDLLLLFGGSESQARVIAPDAPVVDLPVPGRAARRAAWKRVLSEQKLTRNADAELLAARYRLTAERAHAAARAARRAADVTGEPPDVMAAARAESRGGLDGEARKLRTHSRWEDLVLPEDRVAQLRELTGAIAHRSVVFEDWGFQDALTLGRGITALFAGPPGTGKTLAAEVIARDAGLDLYRIDLSTVVSKYIGETEKNLARVFAAAEAGDAILFFDEADALFGRRSEVRDAHDRYANTEISYLLQRMEEYDGVAILATNLRKNMDEAFVRRLRFTIDFPFPGEPERMRIWHVVWPPGVPRAEDLDPAALARRFELSGGSIRNIALGAAFLAASDGRTVTNEHVLHATRRELQKMGNLLAADELRA